MTIFDTMTLGELLDALAKWPADAQVQFDFCNFIPKGLHSYRGWYDHLALGYIETDDCRIGDLHKELSAAVGATFEGYKGGQYRMTRDTPVWVSPYGRATSTAIVGVEEVGHRVVIRTAAVDA